MPEKEIVMKLGAELKAGGAEGLEQLGSAAKDAAAQERKYQELLGRRIDDYKLAQRLKEDLAKTGIGKELTEEQKYQAALRERIKSYQTAKRMKEDLAKAGVNEGGGQGMTGMMARGSQFFGGGGAAGAAVAELAMAAKIGDVIGQQIAHRIPGTKLSEYNLTADTAPGLNRNRLSERQFENDHSLLGLGGKAAGYLGLGGISNAAETSIEADRLSAPHTLAAERLRSSFEALQMTRARQEQQTAITLDRRQLEREQALRGGQAQFGMSSAAAQSSAFLRGQSAINQFQANGAGRVGYDRHQALQDFAGTVAAGLAREQQSIEAKRQLSILGAQQTTGAGQEAEARARLGELREGLPQLIKNKQQGGLTDEQAQERRNALEARYVEIAEAEKRLSDAMQHNRDLAVQKGELLNHQEQHRLQLLTQETTRLQDIVRQEKEREIGRRESFGLKHPMQQRTALGIARKLSRGQQLSQGEIQFAAGMPDLFGQRLKGIAMQRTGGGSFYQEIRKLLPELAARQQQAEKGLAKIEQQFKNEILFDPQKTGDQLARAVLPQLRQALTEVELRMKEQMDRFNNERKGQQRTLYR